MDATLKSIPLEKENILSIMNEILNVQVHDNVFFEIIDIKDIREDDEYGGFKINIIGKLDRLRVNMFVELTTGDIITPKETMFYYNCIFESNKIPIFAYTIETIIAEKFQTVIDRSVTNTRLKDFYDLTILLSEESKKYNRKVLIEAIFNTFEKRNTKLDIDEIKRTIDLIETDMNLNKSWIDYQNKFHYAKGITYESIMENLNILVGMLEKNVYV